MQLAFMTSNKPSLWPEMKTRQGFCAVVAAYPLSTQARSNAQPVSVSVRSMTSRKV